MNRASVVSTGDRPKTKVGDAVRVPRIHRLGVWWEWKHKVLRVEAVTSDGRAVIDPTVAWRGGFPQVEGYAGEWPVVGTYVPGLLGWRFVPSKKGKSDA
jgi:hypothetical protein